MTYNFSTYNFQKMNSKLIVAALLGFLTYFLSGWGVYGGLLEDLFKYPEGMKDLITIPEAEFKMSYMIVSCLLTSVLLTFLFNKIGTNTFLSGAILGAIVFRIISSFFSNRNGLTI